ncbi:MAG: carboxylating nicotinate-nucleotide diphosphorylase, partial [Phycisphaerales bacterium]|nr:carboxylating nicotinate-nucleotide diphosphorylase [Phycisphaerales bacterium]
AGETIARMDGSIAVILAAERTVLNLLGRLSGIATLTRRFVDAVAGETAVVCGTRKTTPGWRGLEKYAVRCGGGTLHRIGLYDAALYKDNHLARLGPNPGPALAAAIASVRREHPLRFVQVEADTLDQVRTILQFEPGLVDLVLLDNMADAELSASVALRAELAPTILLEASGGVTLARVRAVAATGVDRISVGAVTHSAPALDIGLDLEPA